MQLRPAPGKAVPMCPGGCGHGVCVKRCLFGECHNRCQCDHGWEGKGHHTLFNAQNDLNCTITDYEKGINQLILISDDSKLIQIKNSYYCVGEIEAPEINPLIQRMRL